MLLLIVLVAFAFLGLTMPVFSLPSDGSESLKLIHGHLNHGNLRRSYHLYLPKSYDGSKSLPLLLLFHGGGGDGRRMVNFTGFDKVAGEEGVIVVCPDGVERHWDDGRTDTGYRAHEEKVDDVGFVGRLIDTIEHDYKVDASRVYASGISNGAMLSFRLMLETPEKFAGIAAVVGSLPEPLSRQKWNSEPLPLIMINGTRDPLVPYDGGYVKFFGKTKGRVVSVPDTVKFFAEHNRCSSPPEVSELKLESNKSGLSVKRTAYTAAGNGADLEFYAIEGGGHTWPRDSRLCQYLPQAVIGKACRDVDTTALIWTFFQKHRRSVCGANNGSDRSGSAPGTRERD